ncbi:PAC2 family protein, partial [Chloroflexota bacterium]
YSIMDISDFLTDFKLQLPDIKGRPLHAISVHLGWLNWGSVGEESFNKLVEFFKAEKIGELVRPGDFYNFVAYRDYSHTYIDSEGVRHTEFPNSKVFYVRREEPLRDLVLFYLLEPTQFGEIYVDKVVALLKRLNVVRYQVIGAMGSPVPHTRPIRISGRSSAPEVTERLKEIGVRATGGAQYQGPTSIFNSISSRLQSDGVTTVSLIAHMPTYLSLEEPDNNGVFSILNVLSKLEGIEIPLGRFQSAGKKQYDNVTKEVNRSQSITDLSKELEDIYDQEEEKPREKTTQLPPNIQKAIDEAFDKS